MQPTDPDKIRPDSTSPAEDPVPKSGLAASAVSGLRWNYLGNIITAICQLTIGAILARILGPKPFGQITIAATIYGLANLFTDGGFSSALIQKAELNELEVRSTFWFQSGIGFGVAGLIVLAAPLLARVFGDTSATSVVRVMSLIIAVQGLGLTSSALLRRELRFKVIQRSTILSYIIGYLLVGIPLAYLGAGVWALVAAYLTQAASTTILLYATERHSLKPSWKMPPRSMSVFGSQIIIGNVANWAHSNLDNLAVGHNLGSNALGLYGRVCSFAFAPCNSFVGGLQAVLFSSAAKLQKRKEALAELALVAIALTLAIMGPAFMTFAAIPGVVIIGLYGMKWVHAVPLMTPMAIAVLINTCMAVLGPVLNGSGKPGRETWPQVFTAGLAGAAYFAVARHYSLVALTWTVCGMYVLRFLAIAVAAFTTLQVSWWGAFKVLLRGSAFSLLFAFVIHTLDHYALAGFQPLLRLGLVFLASVLLLAASLYTAPASILGDHTMDFLIRYGAAFPAKFITHLRRKSRVIAAAPAA